MRVLIFGAGAIGCYLGGHLALAGHDVTLLGRESLAQAVAQNGLSLRLRAGVRSVRGIRASASLAEALQSGSFDWIAFTMKAYDTVPAIHDLQAALDNIPPIVCFQNGVGNEESLGAAFGVEKIVAATVTTPVSQPAPGVVFEEKPRGIALASDSPAFNFALPSLQDTALTVSIAPDSASLKWSKLLLNILANAIPAILDWTPRAVYQDRRLFALEMDALREAIALADLQGIALINLPGVPARMLADLARWMPRRLLRPLIAGRVISGRGDKAPSLQMALRSGSPRTEVAWLNGAIAQAARALDRLAPINHALALIVSDIASGRIGWDMHRDNPERLLGAVSVARGMKDWWYGE